MNQLLRILHSRLTITTLRQAKRIIKITIGFTLLLVGILMIVLPGPATVVIPIALGILAGEFLWARWLLSKFSYGMRSVFRWRWKKRR
jgi:uncharacterized membrane protein YbaN (DUF454 family)